MTGDIPDIEYDEAIEGVHKGLWIAQPSELTFTVKVRAKDSAGTHLFDKKDNTVSSTKTIYRDKKNGKDKSTSVANDTQAFPTLGYSLSKPYATEVKIPSVRIDLNTPSYKVLPEINPTGSQYGTLKWSIADTDIATINQEGIIVPKKIGTTDIKLIVPVANGRELVRDIQINHQ